jgi:hypothetical protein
MLGWNKLKYKLIKMIFRLYDEVFECSLSSADMHCGTGEW